MTKNKTQKILINSCVGGFGISKEGLRALKKVKCKSLEIHKIKDYFGPNKPKTYISDFCKNFDILKDKNNIIEYSTSVKFRTDPKVIKVFEQIGSERMSGQHAKLKVISIPSDIDFTIEESAGIEWIAETHRTWR